MLTLWGPRCGNGAVARRGFLKVGALAAGGLSLDHVLRARSVQAVGARKQTAVILFMMTGGPSHIDMYDMKPQAPEIVRGPFRPIATRLPGLDVCDLMPRHAEIAPHLAIVRSMAHTYGVHDDAQHLMQTGHPLLNARLRGQQQPCEGAVTSWLRGANQPHMPAYVCIPEDYSSHMGFYQRSVFLGPRHNALNAGGDPALGNYRPPEFHLPAEMTVDRLQNRRLLLGQLDDLRSGIEASGGLAGMDESQQQAFDLVTGAAAKQAFDVAKEPEAVRQQYGNHAYGYGALLARRLVEAGVTFVTINLYEKDVDWWDDHYTIEKNLRKRLPLYDQAFSALVGDLAARELLDRVLVVAWGEFGRAPKIDQFAGRGHWPRAMCAALAGGGIRAGQIVGSTTADGGEPHDRPLTPGDLLASIYHVLGIDAQHLMTDFQGRPIRLVEEGTPIRELFTG